MGFFGILVYPKNFIAAFSPYQHCPFGAGNLRQERFKTMSNLQMLMWSMNITSTSAPEGEGINSLRDVLKCGTPPKNVSGDCTPSTF